MWRKFHWKLTLVYLILIVSTLVLTRVALFPVFASYFEKNQEKQLLLDTKVVSSALLSVHPVSAGGQLDKLVKEMGRKQEMRITIVAEDGAVLADSQADTGKMANHGNRPEIIKALQGQTGEAQRVSSTLGHAMLYMATPLQLYDGKRVALRLSVPEADIAATVNQVQRIVFVGNGLALLLSTLVAFYLSKRFTEPVRGLNRVAQEYAKGNFQERVKIYTSDEFGSLGKTMNEMATKILDMLDDQYREKNKIRAILAGIGDGVVALDREGRIMLVNQAAEILFGRGEEEVLGQYCLSLVRNYRIDNLFNVVVESSSMAAEEVRTGGDPEVILRVHGAPILTGDHQIAGVVLAFRDITTIRQLEQMRTEFVANVSHEMKTPLTSIKGFVETLLDGALEDEQLCRRFLAIISQESERLTRLIEDLLSLAKIEAPRFEVTRQAADFNIVVNKVMEILVPIATSKQVSLHLQVAPDLPQVIIQEDLLGQVLLNLIDNAVKYTPSQGWVEVRAWVEDKVLVEVRDTGMGIPEDALSRIFERFYRVDKARSREIGGTGLGLSIVKHILDRYDQKISVTSNFGHGSSFVFTLEPAEKEEG